MNKSNMAKVGVIALVLLMAGTAAAHAQSGVFDLVLGAYKPHITVWETVIKKHATTLYWSLVLLSMVWTFGTMALKQSDTSEFIAEFLRFTLTTGFFFWLLRDGPTMGNSIVESLRQIGQEASGQAAGLSPQSLLDLGFDLLSKVLDKSSVWSPVDTALMLAIAFACLLLFALIGVEMVLLLISGWILAYAGVFFLGFGGGRWTSEMAINYYKSLLQLAAQVMTMTLLVGIGSDIVQTYATNIGNNVGFKSLAVILVVVVVFWQLVHKVPSMVSGLVSGGHLNSAHGGAAGLVASAVGGAAAAAGAASLAGGMIGTALSGMKETAAGVAGGASAVSSAFGGAMDAARAGTGAFSGGNWGEGGGAVTQAAGRAAQVAAATGANLASGVGQMAKEAIGGAVSDAKSSFKESVGGSLGAQLAENIAGPQVGGAKEGAAMQAAMAALDPNGGGGSGWEGAFASDEVRDFVSGGGSDGGGSGGGSEPWMQASGGVAGLSDAQLDSARDSYDKWMEKRGEDSGGDGFGFGEYVDYVQKKQAERTDA